MRLFFLMVFGLISLIGTAQDGTDPSFKPQMRGQDISKFGQFLTSDGPLAPLEKQMDHLDDILLADAKILCGLFCLCFFAFRSYRIMAGEEKLQILSLLRPFFLTLVITQWHHVGDVIQLPAKEIEQSVWVRVQKVTNEALAVTMKMTDTLAAKSVITMDRQEEVVNRSQDFEQSKRLANETSEHQLIGHEVKSSVSATVSYLGAMFTELLRALILGMTWLVFVSAFCLLRFLQIVLSSILLMVGPIAFALSMIPAFKRNYLRWLRQFIVVQLYTIIALCFLSGAMILLNAGGQVELDAMSKAVNQGDVANSFGNVFMGIGFTMLALLIGIVSFFMVPKVASWTLEAVDSSLGSMVSAAGFSVAAMASSAVQGKTGQAPQSHR
ncbi:MAG: hypothetical protein OXC61_07115 [Flavobacteriaceae bacterium]|nr:hypothetical protein [Flavobacteriaceae bacterium]